ncbi:uncharacterized protein [Drosophila kikkawai]|uniref:Uncharacterized protein n=1 Tax=Drosophila kikkawai TaxID=30033 RepID=A0A6P4I2E6_DROKI|nr:uncharacterized protein LOC108070775 [Drosophila kikkawai]
MHRSVLLLLISVLVLSAASALPASLEESLEEDSQQELKADSVEKVDSIELPKASDSSSEEQKDAAEDKVEFKIDSVSSEEDNQSEKTEEHSMEVSPRRRRSAEWERYRNLELLATICPKKDFKDLEESPSISFRIEIEDMYAVCAKLKDRQS